jgi:hypothetical protein
MFPAAGLEFPGAWTLRNLDPLRRALDCADTFDSHAIDSARQARRVVWFYCEKQLEIFTAVKRELKRIERPAPAQLYYSFVNRQ